MNPNFHMNNGGVARDNDFSTRTNTQTTNHIYLHPDPSQGEFDNWMRQIGSLLQVASEYTAIRPVLELITASLEPQRLFIVEHPPLPEHDTEACTEIMVVMEKQITSKKLTKGMLKMACLGHKNVFVNFETTINFERNIDNGHLHYCALCREENLVFSGSPYRLPKPLVKTIDELKAELPERFNQLMLQADRLLAEAKRLIENQSSNLAALMLHQCLEYLYKNILFMYSRDLYKTHRLARLQRKVRKFFPQLVAQIDEASLDLLDSAYDLITTPHYDVKEIWNAQAVFEDVERTLKIAKAVFEMRIELLFGDNK